MVSATESIVTSFCSDTHITVAVTKQQIHKSKLALSQRPAKLERTNGSLTEGSDSTNDNPFSISIQPKPSNDLEASSKSLNT
jgi:hypothetical protein